MKKDEGRRKFLNEIRLRKGNMMQKEMKETKRKIS